MPIVQHLIVDEYGVHLGRHSERLQVMRIGEGTPAERMVQQAALLHLESVLIAGQGISLSADAVEACCERGIPIHFVSALGQPYAALYAAGLTGTVQTRRAQLLAFADQRGLAFGAACVEGKLHNQATLLKYTAKYRKEADPALFAALNQAADRVEGHIGELRQLAGERIDDVREQLMGIEGRAAQYYWGAIRQLVPESYQWPGRERRGAADPINAALNYGYGIMYGQVEQAIVLAGLDPYAGFVHADRPGKPSLVLDLIEEFRAPVVDRTVLALANQRVALQQDERHLLIKETRKMLAGKVLERLDSPARYERKQHPLRAIIQMQARHVATFLRGERERYVPFAATW
jgi:CRISPR-associated protein Cas1